ncbi:hypothetical protein ID850_08170 [Xenorhabdus sp. Flor]|uniref:hypothetical protein n=1 Tax=Xenorhabdus cabanillasii TaxID=351673 RepID=UPI0019B52495|nr:hypothetical protein [Xenorhabdus sp. Flor]MBD2814740.1 hypothetical protein [Xenorhabdus sp. Flor]
MPFRPPFRTEFFRGDLVYGLTEHRYQYIDNHPQFAVAKVHIDKKLYPPTVIDQYLTPTDRDIIHTFLTDYIDRNNRNDWQNPDEKTVAENIMQDYRNLYKYTKSRAYRKYENNFFDHLKKHNKYHTVIEHCSDGTNEDDLLTIGRKCKGGLSWISMSNSKLTHNIHIHFILDGINMDTIVYKRDKNITGKELRWLFRHREYPEVAAKIQFWLDDRPTSPPWTGLGSNLWTNYVSHDDYSEIFSKLFNIR